MQKLKFDKKSIAVLVILTMIIALPLDSWIYTEYKASLPHFPPFYKFFNFTLSLPFTVFFLVLMVYHRYCKYSIVELSAVAFALCNIATWLAVIHRYTGPDINVESGLFIFVSFIPSIIVGIAFGKLIKGSRLTESETGGK